MRKGSRHTSATIAKMKQVRRNPPAISYAQLTNIMQSETASIINDYVRQYIGVASTAPTPGSGIFINWDRILRTQQYQELAWYDLYDELERDPHIAGILRSRKLAVAGMPWDVFPADAEDSASQEQADFVKDKLGALENINQDIYELMGAVGKGFAVSEVKWRVDPDGSHGIEKILNRPQRRFQFDAVSRTLKLRKIDNPYLGDPLPDRKFIVHRNGSLYENPFGDAVDQSLYWMWLFKKTVLRFWMTYNEVGMASVPIVKHPANAAPELKDEALSIAEQIRSGAYGRIPDNFELLWAEAKNASMTGESYERFIVFVNSEMTKCVKGEVLTTEGSAPSGAGSRALGQVHNDVRADITNFDCRAMEGTLNSSAVKWLIDLRYGPQERYPRFRFVPDEPGDKKTDSEVVLNLKKAGYTATKDWLEEHFDIELEDKEAPPVGVIPGLDQDQQQGEEFDNGKGD